jgi:hypothetical protein
MARRGKRLSAPFFHRGNPTPRKSGEKMGHPPGERRASPRLAARALRNTEKDGAPMAWCFKKGEREGGPRTIGFGAKS